MKKNNPQIPIMLREAQGTLPKVYARYGMPRTKRCRPQGAPLDEGLEWMLTRGAADFGNEKAQSLEGLTDKQIEEAVTGMVKTGA